MAKKPTLGVYSFSGCSGCQIAILNLESILAELLEKFDIKFFHIIQEQVKEENVDVLIVEGAITTKEQAEKMKKLRAKAGTVIAIGSCAVTGGIPAMKNSMDEAKVRQIVFSNIKADHIKTIKATPVDAVVEVDHYIRGCPITKEEFAQVVTDLLAGKKPYIRPYAVCTECRLKENGCLLDEGRVCLGPIAVMGCGAPCPTEGVPCEACRGVMEDANIPALLKILESHGIKKEELNKVKELYVNTQVKDK